MNELEQQLTRDLARNAQLIAVPPVPASFRAHRRPWSDALVAAAIAAIVIGGTAFAVNRFLLDDAQPEVADPWNAPIGVPYLYGGFVHVGDTKIATGADELLHAGSTTLVGKSGETASRWHLVEDGELVPIPGIDGDRAYLSGDGAIVAWQEDHADYTEVFAWSVADHKSLAVERIDDAWTALTGGESAVWVIGVDGRGRVYWFDGQDNITVWDPVADVTATVSGTPGGGTFPEMVGPSGLVFRALSDWYRDVDGVYGSVDSVGVFRKMMLLPDGTGAWAPGGTAFLSPVDWRLDEVDPDLEPGVDLGVTDMATGEVTGVDLGFSGFGEFVWESATAFIVDGAGEGGGIVRCVAPRWTCKRILELIPDAEHPVTFSRLR